MLLIDEGNDVTDSHDASQPDSSLHSPHHPAPGNGPATQSEMRTRASDVAALAGVSLGTVSNVLNHPDRVTLAMRTRVEAAIETLNYRPNRMAQSLAAGRSNAIGLVLMDLDNSLFVQIARGAETIAEEHDMNVVLANGNNNIEREINQLALFSEMRVAGAMITLNDDDQLNAILQAHPVDTPLVILNHATSSTVSCSVAVDNAFGGYLATKHLLEIGCRRLVFVGGPDNFRPIHDRRDGFHRALAEADLEMAQEIRLTGINRADGWAAGQKLAAAIRSGAVDGIFAVSDLLAAGIVQALVAEGDVRIPTDVAVVGYDNNQSTWDSPLPVTTIAQPGEEMGRVGTAMVVAESSQGMNHEHETVILRPHLVTRASTERAI